MRVTPKGLARVAARLGSFFLDLGAPSLESIEIQKSKFTNRGNRQRALPSPPQAQRAQRERGVSLRRLCVLFACGGEAWLEVCKPTSLNLYSSGGEKGDLQRWDTPCSHPRRMRFCDWDWL